jgi:glycosyltransferase involved in cell wall biosynthesis
MDHCRILFFTSSLRTGGAEHHLLSLCRWLRSAGHESAVCTLSPVEDGIEKLLLDGSIPLFRCPLRSLRSLPSPRVASALRRVVRGFQPDLIHAHLFHGEVAAAFASVLVRVPVVVTRHSAGLEFRGWRASAGRALGSRVAACIAVSREAAEEALAMGYHGDKVVVIPNAVDPERFRPVEEPARGRRRSALIAELFGDGSESRPLVLIGSAGGLKPVKNFPLMLRVASALLSNAERSAEGPGLRFVIFGEGRERENLAVLSRDLGIERFVSLPGKREALEEIYPLLDVFLLPSLTEGVPLALLEAMSSGLACLASDVGGVGDVLRGAGALARSQDESSFVEALQRLVRNGDERKELGRRARVRVLERYNIDIWGERTLAVYRSVLDPARRT